MAHGPHKDEPAGQASIVMKNEKDLPYCAPGSKFVVAGHLCLDLTPALGTEGLPEPGQLAQAGPLQISTGGAVPNVGCAIYRLGYPVGLVARLGDDLLSNACIQLLEPLGPQPGLRKTSGHSTSYSIVIAPKDEDRAFLHCTGANATFVAADVRDSDLDGAIWMHFGYPPIMQAMTADGGRELAELFRKAVRRGIRTSLDFCAFDSSAAAIDWETMLRNCANFVTLFAPSIDELRSALNRSSRVHEDVSDVALLANHLFDLGFSIVAIKLGTNGLYLATTRSEAALSRWSLGPAWVGRELLAPCFQSNFINASGAGDCTIAGLVSAIAEGCNPEEAATRAVAVGASSTEAADASSGVPTITELEARIRRGWPRLNSKPPDDSWRFNSETGFWAPMTTHVLSSH